jgi:hypothetical protein
VHLPFDGASFCRSFIFLFLILPLSFLLRPWQTRSKLSTFVEIMMNLDWLVILGHKAIDVEMARKNKVNVMLNSTLLIARFRIAMLWWYTPASSLQRNCILQLYWIVQPR